MACVKVRGQKPGRQLYSALVCVSELDSDNAMGLVETRTFSVMIWLVTGHEVV